MHGQIRRIFVFCSTTFSVILSYDKLVRPNARKTPGLCFTANVSVQSKISELRRPIAVKTITLIYSSDETKTTLVT